MATNSSAPAGTNYQPNLLLANRQPKKPSEEVKETMEIAVPILAGALKELARKEVPIAAPLVEGCIDASVATSVPVATAVLAAAAESSSDGSSLEDRCTSSC